VTLTISSTLPAEQAGAAFSRHRGPVTSVAVVPGSSLAVTAAYDGAVALFDLATGAVELLGYHRHLANHVTVDRTGGRAASSSSDYDIYIWDLVHRRRELVLRGHSDDVECFAFIDERTGVSASRDRRILVWDLTTGAVLRAIDEHEKDVLSVACFDGLLYSSGDDMTLRQWDLATGRMLRKWGPFEHETDTCAVDPVNGRVLLGCDDGVIRAFDSRSGELVAEIAAHTSGIKKVGASPVTGDILSAAYDQRIRIWDASTFELKSELAPLLAKWERSFTWSGDGKSVLAGTFDGTVVVWDAATGRRLQEVGAGGAERGNACFNEVSANASGEMALVSDDGVVRLGRLTPTSSRLDAAVEPKSGRILMNAVTLDDAAGIVATGAHDHKLHIFTRSAGGLGDEIETALGEGPINSLRVAHVPGYENEIFAACYSGAIVRASRDGRILAKHRIHDGAVKALRIHPRQPIGVSCSADGALLTWTLEGEVLERFLGHTSIIDDVDFDPAGEQIASASRDFTLKVYRVADGRLVSSIDLGRRSPKSLCFWDAGTVIVADYWGALSRVDLRSGRITRKTIARNGISSVSRTGEGLLASSYDGAVYLVAPDDLSVRNEYRAMRQRPDAWQ
jgi:WD40 repeat protein